MNTIIIKIVDFSQRTIRSIMSLKAGGEVDSLRGAFEKEMSLWTIAVYGGPPSEKKRAIDEEGVA